MTPTMSVVSRRSHTRTEREISCQEREFHASHTAQRYHFSVLCRLRTRLDVVRSKSERDFCFLPPFIPFEWGPSKEPLVFARVVPFPLLLIDLSNVNYHSPNWKHDYTLRFRDSVADSGSRETCCFEIRILHLQSRIM